MDHSNILKDITLSDGYILVRPINETDSGLALETRKYDSHPVGQVMAKSKTVKNVGILETVFIDDSHAVQFKWGGHEYLIVASDAVKMKKAQGQA